MYFSNGKNNRNNSNNYPTYNEDGTMTPGFAEGGETPTNVSLARNSFNNYSQNKGTSIEMQIRNSPEVPSAMAVGYNHFPSFGQGHYSFGGVTSKICEVDSKISKYSDFVTLCYGMLIWSILCFLVSIWDLTNVGNTYFPDDNEKKTESFDWFETFCFFVNLYHCGAYFFAIRSYNHQSKSQMTTSHYLILGLMVINFLYFLIYIFIIRKGFFAFCINLVFLIFNVLLYFQSAELSKLYEEKEVIKIMYQ